MKNTWKPMDYCCEGSAKLACLINSKEMLIRYYEQVLTSYDKQIPPRFNMYLIINNVPQCHTLKLKSNETPT